MTEITAKVDRLVLRDAARAAKQYYDEKHAADYETVIERTMANRRVGWPWARRNITRDEAVILVEDYHYWWENRLWSRRADEIANRADLSALSEFTIDGDTMSLLHRWLNVDENWDDPDISK